MGEKKCIKCGRPYDPVEFTEEPIDKSVDLELICDGCILEEEFGGDALELLPEDDE